jgi:hypothetical protein
MLKLVGSGAVVLALLPVIWVSSAAWASALSVGLICHEVRARLRRT